MSRVITSLNEISQQYTVFTKDQVLTDQQLNSVTTYLDDQQRLSRTALSGVGIVQGLVVNMQGNQLQLSQGLGITRDGDLFANYNALIYDRAKLYPEDGPEYKPFMKADTTLPLYQLVEKGEKDDLAKPLSSFVPDSPALLKNSIYILFAESIIEDKDLCTATDCDNGSRTYHSRMRLLCIDAKFAEFFIAGAKLSEPSEQEMQRLYVRNIRFDASIDTQTEWFRKILQPCEASVKELSAVLGKFWPTYKPYLQHYVEGNPSDNWVSRLQAFATKARSETTRLPYFYEFLQDLASTWNDLLDELEQASPSMLSESTIDAKHLLLGGLGAIEPRSAFIVSPVYASDAMGPVLFYIEKINTLLSSYGWAHITALKITPSVHTLPSVPGFYREAVFNSWHYSASKANKTRYLLGYHADKNKPLGGADSPLNRSQARNDYYRVEGVLGKAFTATHASVKNLIKANHLPFSVAGVLIEGDFNKVIKPNSPFRNTLTQFNYLLKTDLSYQLQDVTKFSGLFKNEVLSKTAEQSLVEGEHLNLDEQVQMRDTEIKTEARKAISLLTKPNLSPTEKVSFTASVNNVVKSAGLFKNDVARVSSTHFPTKFDQLIVNPTSRWIGWLDILQKADEKEDKEKSQLPHFLNQHAGFEVSNGVVRGGTFVLIYNAGGTIIGTGMLSHYIPMPIEKPTVRPQLPKFETPLDIIPLPGIEVKPSFELEINRKLNNFGLTFTKKFDTHLANTTSYAEAFKESISIVKDLNTTRPRGEEVDLPGKIKVDVPSVDAALASLEASRKEIDLLNKQIESANTSRAKGPFIKRKDKKQQQMAEDIYYAASYTDDDPKISEGTKTKIIDALVASGPSIAGNPKAVSKVRSFATERQSSKFASKLNKSIGAKFGP
ncbi:MAG: hypothetical protein ACJAVV_003048 [Alphaproteobacteria bacterium]|jgi:hypothetical protein